jgi:hypothetical protein
VATSILVEIFDRRQHGAHRGQRLIVNVPAPGNLPPGAAPNAAGAEGMWLRLTLPAGTGAYKGTAYLRTQGTTT